MTPESTLSLVEPTAAQLAVMETLERRAAAVFAEIAAIEQAIDALGPFGENIGFDVESEPGYELAGLHRLRVTGGREGFEHWYRYRVSHQEGLSFVIDNAEGATADGNRHYRQMLAIEAKVLELDPEFINELNLATGAAIDPGGSDRQLALNDKTSEAWRALVSRADALITTLIDSGWRP